MLTKWFKKKVAQWARESWEADKQKSEIIPETAVSRDVDHNTIPKIRVGLIGAMNGRILEVATATQVHGHNHYDWKTEMYIVPEDQSLGAAMATVMLMKGLEK